MSDRTQEQCLALAGLFQACAMVERLAKNGICPQAPYKCSLESLFQQNPDSTLAVFGSVANLELGLETLAESLHDHKKLRHADALKYALGILHLERKLGKNKDMMSVIGSRVTQASEQANHFETTHDNVVANIAEIYTDTISTFRYRIQVNGDINLLQQQRIANQIRALLLAAVRSAMLWRQLGGKRLHLVLGRGRLITAVDQLAAEARATRH